jgi:DNA-binding response OmpR family regulator
VVDDEPLIRNLLEQFLTLRDYRVRTASDGTMALDMVEQEQPQFIVLDMYMPRMNGVEVLRALKAKNYPGRVLVLTASQDQKLLLEAHGLGTIDILGKPVDLERLALALQIGSALQPLGKVS